MTTISNKARGLLYAQEVRAKFPFLIKVSCDGFEDMYYCNSDEAIIYKGYKYNPAIFKITPPETTATSIGNATLEMSTVDQEWIRKIRSTDKRAKIQFIGVIQYNNDKEVVVEPIFNNTFTLTKATWTEIFIKWTMIFDDKWDIIIPPETCNSINCNGVY